MSPVEKQEEQCPICLESALLTREDAIPRWLRHVVLVGSGVPRARWPPPFVIKICQECNAGFGRRLEHVVAPLLKPLVAGQAVSLSSSEQAIVSRWIVKTDIMMGLANENNRRSTEDPRWLEELRLLLREYDGQVLADGMGSAIHLTGFSSRDPVGPLIPVRQLPAGWPRPALLVALGRFGFLGWQTFIGSATDAAALCDAIGVDERFYQIRPSTDTTLRPWPPPVLLTNLDAEALSDAWGLRVLRNHLS